MKNIYIVGLLSFLFFGCKEEEKILVEEDIDTTLTTVAVNLTENYEYQAFFSFDGYQEVSRNFKIDWDLAVEEIDGALYLSMNSARAMYAAISNGAFEETTTETDLDFSWDSPEGLIEELVIGNGIDQVYVIDMGYSSSLEHQGFKKIMFQSTDLTASDLNGENNFEQKIIVNSDLRRTPLSLTQMLPDDFFPKTAEWDLLFTQYTHEFDENTPYLVSGVLLNTEKVSVGIDTLSDFLDIDMASAQECFYSNNLDAIGYDWKNYSREQGAYSINYHINYILKTELSEYYKLRFIDFYDEQGIKGNMEFEIVRIID